MDKIVPRPCPGKEDDFNEKHGTSGFVIFLAVVLPFLAAGGIGYWVWKNWSSKGFGQIRLGETCKFLCSRVHLFPFLPIPERSTRMRD